MDKAELVIGGKYQHFKGNYYKVLDCGKHSETLEEYVVYQALYGGFGTWVRPKEMFLEMVDVDGESKPRFALVAKMCENTPTKNA